MTDIPPLNTTDGTRIFTNQNKADILKDHFVKMHENTLSRHNMIFTIGINSCATNYIRKANNTKTDSQITSGLVSKLIKTLGRNKAPGPDTIPSIAIKNYSFVTIEYLTKILKACLDHGHYPTKWKTALTIPVLKPGKDPNERTSYRPISLTSGLSKILDKLILAEFTTHCDTNNLLPDFQFGFRKGHSTDHALTHVTNYIKGGFDSKKSTAVLSFDIEKAFDRTWHNGLIYKMIKSQFPENIIKITNCFIKDRQFKVKIKDSTSDASGIDWGVPQGSALSPILYSFYISDINTLPETNMTLYADDTLIYTQNRNLNLNIDKLKTAAVNAMKYYKKWKIQINTDKTNLTYFTLRRTRQIPSEPLTIGNDRIPWDTSLKYLGIQLDRRLTLKMQVMETIKKVDKQIRLLYPLINRRSPLDKKVKLHLYKTYIRPVLTYGFSVTDSMAMTTKVKLKRKQNIILRMLLDLPWDTSSQTLENISNLEPIDQCIARQKELFLNRCINATNPIIRQMT